MNKVQKVHTKPLAPMDDTNIPPAPAPKSPSDSKTPPANAKSLTIEQIVQHAAMQLDGLGLDEKLIGKAVARCAEQTDRVAASALHSVLSEHISQLSPKVARKPRKAASGDQPLA